MDSMTDKEYKELYTNGQCATCGYRGTIYVYNNYPMCNYLLETGKCRNSLPPNCDKYKPENEKQKNIFHNFYL